MPSEIKLTVNGSMSANGALSATGTDPSYIAGNVGIGTTSSSEILTINGSGSNKIAFHNGTNNRAYIHNIKSGNNTSLAFGTTTNVNPALERLRIDYDGNVGIGTTSPDAKLVVKGANSSADFADYGIAVFENQQSEGLSIGYDTGDNYTYLYSREVGVSSRGLRLNGSIYVAEVNGNVGIGDTTPSYKLDVAGDINSQSNILSGGVDLASIFCTSAGTGTVTSVTAGEGMTQTGVSTVNPTLNVIGAANGGICVTADAICVDSTVVRTCGAQTICGAKCFTDNVRVAANIYHTGDTNTRLNFGTDTLLLEAGGNCGLQINSGSVIVNQNSGSVNFRVEGNTDAALLMANAATDKVGIGTTSPSERLHIHNCTGNGATIRLSDPDSTSTADATGYVEVYHGENTSRAGYFGLITNSEMALATTTSAGNIKLYTGNNTAALTIDSSQRVGIGTTSPDTSLTIKTGSSAGLAKISSDGNGAAYSANGDVQFYTNNSAYAINFFSANKAGNLMRITDSGNVGIGCTAPTQKLAVAGDGLFTSNLTVQGSLSVTGAFTCLDTTISVTSAMDITNHGTGPALLVNQTGSNDIVDFRDDGTSVFYIEDGGFVGLGTTNPTSLLHLESASSPTLQLKDTTQGTTFKAFSQDSNAHLGTFSNHSLVFDTNSGERMRILTNGNVGISDSSPGHKLDVGGNINATGSYKLDDNDVINSACRFVGSGISLADSSSIVLGDSDDLRIYHDGSNSFINDQGTGSLYLQTNAFRLVAASGTENIISAFENGAVNLFYDNASKLQTTSAGINVCGSGTFSSTINATQLCLAGSADTMIDLNQTGTDTGWSYINFKTLGTRNYYVGQDNSKNFNIYNDNIDVTAISVGFTNANVTLGADLTVSGGDITLGGTGRIQGIDTVSATTDAANKLYVDNAVAGGVGNYLPLSGGTMTGNLNLNDNVNINIGASNDLQLYHNGSHSLITNQNGDLYIRNQTNDGDIKFQADDGAGGDAEYFRLDGGGTPTIETSVQTNYYATVNFDDNVCSTFGTGNDLKIYHNSTNSNIANYTGDLAITNAQDDGDITFSSDDGSGGTATYMRIDGGSTNVQFFKDVFLTDNTYLNIGGDFDLRLFHDTNNSYIQSQGTGHLIIQQTVDDKDIIFKSDDGSGGVTEYLRLDGSTEQNVVSKNMRFEDNIQAQFGAGSDLRIYHNGSNSYIDDTGTGSLYIRGANDVNIRKYTGEEMIKAIADGAVELYYDNSKKFETFSGGVSVTGSVNADQLHLGDGDKALFGNSNDLQIYHDGSNSYINETGTGDLIIKGGNDILFQDSVGNTLANMNEANSVELYYGGSKKFETTAAGVEITGTLDVDVISNASGSVHLNDTLYFQDNGKAVFGNSSDLQIYHDGSDSYIKDVGTGELRISGSATRIYDADMSSLQAEFKDGGSVDLYYDSNKKFATTTDGIQLYGNGYLDMPDNGRLRMGASYDLAIFHDSSNSYIQNNGTGSLITNTCAFLLKSANNGEFMMTAYQDGAVNLYHNNTTRLSTTACGINVCGDALISGHVCATTKSFVVDNPTTGGQLRYSVVEGNEHGVTVRGSTCSGTIDLPDEWDWLVDGDSVTAQLTPVGGPHQPYVVSQDNKQVVVCSDGCYNYNIYGTRKDVEPLEVNIL